MDKNKLELITKNENVIGHKFKCTENDNEINFYHVDGNVDDSEFHIGHETGIGGWCVIGKKDMMECLTSLELIEPEVTTQTALEILREKLKDDDSFAWSWHCNVAVPMQDEGISHELSNKIATRLMKHLFGVDTSKEMILTKIPDDVEKDK